MNGVVVAPQPAAVETGAEILEQGGNAFDAAVAAGYMQMVVDPFMCGLGGWGAADSLRRGHLHIQPCRILAPDRIQDVPRDMGR